MKIKRSKAAKNFRFSTVILLAFIVVLSMVIIASLVSAGGVTSYPTGTITIQPGETFLLRHELYFNESGVGGCFAVAINWDAPNSDENFTLENTPSVYWISGPESGSLVENVRWSNESYIVDDVAGCMVGVWIDAEDMNYVDGHFNVDIWLRACSGDGTLHRPMDNHPLSYGGGIAVIESNVTLISVDPVTVQVLGRGVDVSISPSENSAFPGENVTFAVTVMNTGNMDNDNYILTVGDNISPSWNPMLVGDNLTPDNRVENVESGQSRTVTLTVTIPTDAIPGTNDNIWVAATSTRDENVRDNASCLGHAAGLGVEVSISPPSQENFPGRTLSYTVTVKNNGDYTDNFTLENSDNASWVLSLSDNFVGPLDPGASDNHVTLTVTIPKGTPYCTWDNITVTARSQENENVRDNASCLGHAASPGVRVSISPLSQDNFPGRTLSYTVTITNISVGVDNYTLDNSDSLGWGLVLSDNFVGPLDPGASDNVTLTVAIPEGTPYGTLDNITVTATSQANNAVEISDNCGARAASPGVSVSISPPSQDNFPGRTLSYTVTITNISVGVDKIGRASCRERVFE